jgi:hypothetical protein
MKYEDVLKDIEKLTGKKLLCISPHAMPLEIIKVDWNTKRVLVRATNGNEISRSFQELEKVWTALQELPAVHVDSDALNGGGSMRNQPETIFANLPYVEYVVIDRKKHLVLMPSETHAIGTLRKMDQIMAQDVVAKKKKQSLLEPPPSSVIVCRKLKECIDKITNLTGISAEPVCGNPYAYKMYKPGQRILFLNNSKVPEGVYMCVQKNNTTGISLEVQIDKYALFWPDQNICMLFAVAD